MYKTNTEVGLTLFRGIKKCQRLISASSVVAISSANGSSGRLLGSANGRGTPSSSVVAVIEGSSSGAAPVVDVASLMLEVVRSGSAVVVVAIDGALLEAVRAVDVVWSMLEIGTSGAGVTGKGGTSAETVPAVDAI